MDNRKYLGGITYQLSGAGAIIGATTLTINNFVDADGNAITMSGSFGTKGYATLQPGTVSQQEFITFTGVTDNGDGTWTLTGVSSQLAQAPYTETSGLSLQHPGASSMVISNTPGFYDGFTNKNDDEAIDGTWTFNTDPQAISTTHLATDDAQYITKYFFDTQGGSTPSLNNRIVEAGTAGENLVAGDLVYLKVADGKWWKTDADTAATVDDVQLGIAQGAGSANGAITTGVLIQGLDSTHTGLTAATVYYAGNTAGAISSSPGTTVRVIGQTPSGSTTTLYFNPIYATLPTTVQKGNFPSTGEKQALAGGGAFGTPSSSNKYITQDYNASSTGLPVPRVYGYTSVGSSTTQFDITNPAGTTFRYTYDGNGTDPVINTSTFPTGAKVYIWGPGSISFVNAGAFTVTNSGTNFFEITNAAGSAENNVVLGATGFLMVHIPPTWSKPSGLKYITVEVIGGGSGGGGNTTANTSSGGGGAGGYARKLIAASALGATETVTVGAGGKGGADTGATGTSGGTSSFGSLIQSTGGTGGQAGGTGGAAGVGTLGDINITCGRGGEGISLAASVIVGGGGRGGNTPLGFGGVAGTSNAVGNNGTGYGSGGSGLNNQSGNDIFGGSGMPGVIILVEYFS